MANDRLRYCRVGFGLERVEGRDVATSKDLPDQLKWVKFSGASWTADNKGFFYSRYAEPNEDPSWKGEATIKALFTGSGRRRIRTSWSMNARTIRIGASAAA